MKYSFGAGFMHMYVDWLIGELLSLVYMVKKHGIKEIK